MTSVTEYDRFYGGTIFILKLYLAAEMLTICSYTEVLHFKSIIKSLYLKVFFGRKLQSKCYSI